MATLYRRILGESFDTLPPVLRGFHDLGSGGAASGTLAVIHGQGRLCALLVRLGRLPSAGSAIPVRLWVVSEGPRERWIREIGGRRLETLAWCDRGLLVEALGPIRCGYQVDASPKGMRLRSVRGWFSELPLPPALMPRVVALVTGRGDGWSVRVSVEIPWVGLLIRYEGEVTPA